MRNKFDNFLLGTLWLLISTLGLCFWFNISFGFNLFSSAHWQHLSYMQATRAQITPAFYTSLIIGVFCIIFGLYIIIRPRFRKIDFTSAKKQTTPNPTQTQTQTQPQLYDTYPERPKRLTNIIQPAPVATNNIPFTAPIATSNPVTTNTHANLHEEDTIELHKIFASTGYTVKKSPKIHGVQIPLVAIGQSETVWIGAFDMETSSLKSIIDTIQQIFADTLDDVVITTKGFVINASDAASPTAPDILNFANLSELNRYMQQHPNPQSDPDSAENFAAFSEYISTVLDYIGRL